MRRRWYKQSKQDLVEERERKREEEFRQFVEGATEKLQSHNGNCGKYDEKTHASKASIYFWVELNSGNRILVETSHHHTKEPIRVLAGGEGLPAWDPANKEAASQWECLGEPESEPDTDNQPALAFIGE